MTEYYKNIENKHITRYVSNRYIYYLYKVLGAFPLELHSIIQLISEFLEMNFSSTYFCSKSYPHKSLKLQTILINKYVNFNNFSEELKALSNLNKIKNQSCFSVVAYLKKYTSNVSFFSVFSGGGVI